jgi:CHASE2 domain-containing sensor protein
VFDDESLRFFDRPPWDRDVYGSIIRVLKEAGVALIACDIFFQQKGSSGADDGLVKATGEAGNVYYPVILYEKSLSKDGSANEISSRVEKTVEANLWKPDMIDGGKPYKTGLMLAPYKELLLSAKGIGHINCTPDPDGINRKFPLLYGYGDGFLPALTLRMVCDYLKIRPEKIVVEPGKYLILKNAVLPGKRERDISIPIDERGRAIVNYIGPWKDSFYSMIP